MMLASNFVEKSPITQTSTAIEISSDESCRNSKIKETLEKLDSCSPKFQVSDLQQQKAFLIGPDHMILIRDSDCLVRNL
jgi:hypothetical protein